MKKIYSFLIIACVANIFISSVANSQPISKGQFRQMYTQGNLMMLEGNYDTACRTFQALHLADSTNANVNYKVGVCYLHILGEREKAIPYLERAVRFTKGNFREDDPAEKNAPEDVSYYLGQAYHYAYRFDEAIAQFAKFRELIGKWNVNLLRDLDRWTEISKNAKKLVSNPVECTITNLGDEVNSKFPDYSPVISADEEVLVFTSRREGTGGAENKTIEGHFFEDIWVCTRGEYGSWKRVKSIGKSINSEGNEATIGLSADGQQLYVYRDDNGDGNIYISKLDGDYWTPPYKMDAGNVNTGSWEPSACISADGNTMYFVSNRPGGLGGRDIYQCRRLPNRAWSEPENLGPTINTPYDEDAPFIHPDGITFFFSSTGHNSMGGFDIFYSTKVSNNVWTTCVNMGYPVNTTDDDIYFVTSSDGRRAYYSSFRPGGKGEKDLYMVSMPQPFVQSVAILVGYLKTRDGAPIPKNSTLSLKGPKEEVFYSKINEASGKFLQSMLPGKEYEIMIEANNEKIFSDRFFLPDDSSYQKLGRGFFQRTIYIGDTSRLFSATAVRDTSKKSGMAAMSGRILLSKDSNNAAANVSIQLLNAQGNVIAAAVTDGRGSFTFRNIPTDQRYIVKINENDPVLRTNNQFYLSDTQGKVIMPSTQEGRFFLFKNVSPDLNKTSPLQEADAGIVYSEMIGKIVSGPNGKTPVAGTSVRLRDAQGNVIQTGTTDKQGRFVFDRIPSDKNYSIMMNEDDPMLKNNQNIFLSNARDELIRKISKVGDYFIFENLPADLNRMGAISAVDSALLVPMRGKMLKGINPPVGVQGLDVSLVDNKGKAIQRAKTDSSGAFSFSRLSADKNYTIRINENDPLLSSLQKLYLANEAGKAVKSIDLKKRENTLKNLPADLLKLAEMKEALVTTAREELTIDPPNISSADGQFDFVVYFTYNKKEIDISVASFLGLMEKVSRTINEKGKATIVIASSSSTVPTSSYESNEVLAQVRANEIKDKVRASMSLRNIDDSKITYEVVSKVQGPAYANDAVAKRKEYEKWQFVKVQVQ